jgi:SAM-dependent methyltransferase
MPAMHGSARANAAGPISGGEMTGRSDWQGRVGASWARAWRRTDRSFRELTGRLVAVAESEPIAIALDIGCGAGELVERLARDAPSRRIIGVDLSERLIEVARARTAGLANARIDFADAAQWRAEASAAPDLVVSRHGVMFFDEPDAAFAHIRTQAAPAARMVFSCFRRRAENEWVRALAAILPELSDPGSDHAPGPFAFGDRAHVEDLLGRSGWRDIAFEAFDFPYIAGEGAHALAQARDYFLTIGPAARALAELDEDARRPALERLDSLLGERERDGVVSLPAAAWIVTARSS